MLPNQTGCSDHSGVTHVVSDCFEATSTVWGGDLASHQRRPGWNSVGSTPSIRRSATAPEVAHHQFGSTEGVVTAYLTAREERWRHRLVDGASRTGADPGDAAVEETEAKRLAGHVLIVLEGAVAVGGIYRDEQRALDALDLVRDLVAPALPPTRG